ncbi:hypothetical protein HYN86_06020 [Flavobacterium fluviale]|uniref:Uncharacterized protein n=1 Tax=Flavobacterium fluviale TaxID=2249356 RepID=A0A344LQI7_9FLAO|nr:hypothetical protein HYN86_06020 [Flavobacterium fluviale]
MNFDAPYQRELSNRGKYLDKLLEDFSSKDMIKKDYLITYMYKPDRFLKLVGFSIHIKSENS